MIVLVTVSIAMKRHHGHSNSYKRKHLIGTGLQFRGLVHYCHGRKQGGIIDGHGSGEVAESSTSGSAGSRKRETLAWLVHLKLQSPSLVKHFPQQGHTS